MLRRIGSTPSYDQIIGKYRSDRDLGRHAGANNRNVAANDLELDGVLVDAELVDVQLGGSLDTSIELQ